MTVACNTQLAELGLLPRLVGPYEREAGRGRPYYARVGANESLFGPSAAALEVLASRGRLTNFYGDPDHTELRALIGVRWGRPVKEIIVGEGVEGLLELFARGFLNPGEFAVLTRGSYPTLSYYVRCCAGRVHLQPYTEDLRIDFDGLISAAWRNEAKLVYVANPDNPTGRLATPGRLAEFMDRLPPGCLLLLDEAYAEYCPDDGLLAHDARWPNLVRLRSFSKAYGLAGARVGYAIAEADVLRVIELVRQRYGVSRLSQEMAAAALVDADHLRGVRDATAEARADYERTGAQIGIRCLPSSANFVTFDFGTPILASHVMGQFEDKDILAMQPGEPSLRRLVRVTAAPAATRRYLAQHLQDAMAAAPAALAGVDPLRCEPSP